MTRHLPFAVFGDLEPSPMKSIRWPQLSIRHAVLLAVAVAVIGPTLLLWQVEQEMTRRAHEPLLEQSRSASLALAAATLVEPVWSIDEAATLRAAKLALDDPAVLGVTVVENRPGAVPVVVNRPRADAGAAPSIVLRTVLHREGERLGELEMRFDPRQIDRVLAERRRTGLMLAGVQTVLGLLVLTLLLYRRLVNPINRLMAQASGLATRGQGARVVWTRQDELGQLGTHLNAVHDKLDALFEQLQGQKTEIEHVAMHDALTGLPNRTLFAELARSAVAAAQRDGSRLALLFIDLDRFKAVNDEFGHAGGDALLRTLSARLIGAVRQADVVCRHSGDEFLVLLREARELEVVAATADRLLKLMEEPVPLAGREAVVSASIGIAMYPDDAADPETLVRHADTAMYVAKRMGRDRHSFFRQEFDAQLRARQELEREIERALAEEQFELHYQPQVGVADGVTAGCEALIRWRHPERGLVPPGQFIPAAEQCGSIADIGAWTLRSACRQIAQWKAAGIPFVRVAVNVSALEFRGRRLLDTLNQAMAEHGVRPHELEIEITESVLMTDTESTQRIVASLHRMGLPLAVDDFGTGYSSLAYLKHLRPSKVKIDRSFVRDIEDDRDGRVIVQAIVGLAHALGIRVVAEGVETVGQRDFLRSIGCQLVQGYLISRPQPAAEAARFMVEAAREEAVA
jgi:diguanylate cyclase (GGDEF)-like protein